MAPVYIWVFFVAIDNNENALKNTTIVFFKRFVAQFSAQTAALHTF